MRGAIGWRLTSPILAIDRFKWARITTSLRQIRRYRLTEIWPWGAALIFPQAQRFALNQVNQEISRLFPFLGIARSSVFEGMSWANLRMQN